jgi:precorrin-4/cobalt-precorrin-4 C11-methyltransferase
MCTLRGVISFIGAGPGAADLLTLRAVGRLARADVVLWAGSLVSAEVLSHCRADATLLDTRAMTLEDVTAVYAAHPNAAIARLHSGDSAWFSAVGEQIDWCVQHERAFEIVPGVSSLGAAAAAAGVELTVPGVSQSVVITRLARRTAAALGPGDDLVAYAARGGVMALFLSAGDPECLQATLLSDGSAYREDTPTLIAYRVSWPDEQVVATTLGQVAAELARRSIASSALILIGDALRPGASARRSHVYDPSYGHQYRASTASP